MTYITKIFKSCVLSIFLSTYFYSRLPCLLCSNPFLFSPRPLASDQECAYIFSLGHSSFPTKQFTMCLPCSSNYWEGFPSPLNSQVIPECYYNAANINFQLTSWPTHKPNSGTFSFFSWSYGHHSPQSGHSCKLREGTVAIVMGDMAVWAICLCIILIPSGPA